MSTDTSRSRQSFYQSSSGDNSFGDLSYATDDHPPPLPSNPSVGFNGHVPKKSIDTLASTFTNLNGQIPSPVTRSKSPYDFPPVPSQPQVQTQMQPQLPSRPSQNRTQSRDAVTQVGRTGPTGPSAYHPPRTPPRSASQTFRVVNGDNLSQSPPPAYYLDGPPPVAVFEKLPLSSSQSQQQTPQPKLRKVPSTRQQHLDREPRASVMSTSTVTPGSILADQSMNSQDTSEVSNADLDDEEPTSLPPLDLSMSSLSMSPAVPAKKKKRYSLAPPRLSLGQDAFADIGSWGDSLFDSLSATTPATADSTLGESTSGPVLDGTGPERKKPEMSLSAGVTGSTLLATKGERKEKGDKKEMTGPPGLASPSSPLISLPLATTQSLPVQKTYQPSQPPPSQSQVLAQSQPQSRRTPPPKTAPIIPISLPPTLSSSTSSMDSTSTSGSNSQPKTRVLPSSTKVADRATPSPVPFPTRGRTGPDPPKSADHPLSKTTPTNSPPKSQSQPRSRSNSRASTVHRPLPPQKPLPTLSLMSPIPLPNPPSHVELKSKISTVSLKTAAKRDKEKEREKGKESEKVGKVGDVGKEKEEKEVVEEVKAKAKQEAEERWPMTAKERIELMASINHDNGGLDFRGKKDEGTPAPPDLNEKTSSVSFGPSYDVRDSHLSVDSTRFDPNRLSNTSAGSGNSTRSSGGSGLKMIIRGGDYHNDNRDSNVSTSTITNATIVSGPVEVATRARADLVVSPGTPIARIGLAGLSGSTGSLSLATSGTPSPVEPLSTAESRETTPMQTTPPVTNVDVVADDERSRFGFEGRSPSPGSSTHSHSSSSATTLSSTALSSLGSANKTAGFTRPVTKQRSGWEGEEAAGEVVVSGLSSSSSTSPYELDFDDESDGDEVEVGDEEEDVVITRVSPPPPGSRKGSTAGLTDEVTGHRRPSLVIPPLSPHSLMAHEPLTTAVSVTQMLSPFNGAPHSAGSGGTSPAQRYPGWVSNVLSKVGLEIFVDEKVEPRDFFDGLSEVAEGESGFVYQAKVVRAVPKSKLTQRVPQPGGVVAVKAVPILPSGSSKLEDLRREVEVMKRVFEDDKSSTPQFSSASGYPTGVAHVLIMEAMYVDLQEDALWIRMELMERSLADVVALVEEGHLERIDEKVIARFACDVSARSLVSLVFVGGFIARVPCLDCPSVELPPRLGNRPS